MNISQLTDRELFQKCQEYGNLSLQYRKRFCGLLPEVARRKLYEKHKMHSIYEFAAKLAGLSRNTVNEVIRIDKKFANTPFLREKLQTGEVGYTKLRTIVSVVQPETEKLWAEKVESMSKQTLEMYVQEVKKSGVALNQGKEVPDNSEVNQLDLPGKESEEPHFMSLSFKVSEQTEAQLRVYKQQLEKKCKKVLSWEEVMKELLKGNKGERAGKSDLKKIKKRSTKMKKTKAKSKKSWKEQGLNKNGPKVQRTLFELKENTKTSVTSSRYIPASIKKEIHNKYHGVCAFPHCNKPSEILHHTKRFALDPEHSAKSIVPLCKTHERIAHQSLIEHEEQNPKNWKVGLYPNKQEKKFLIDKKVQAFRMPT